MNALRTMLFGSGRIPAPLRGTLAAEGIWLLEEGMRVTITWRNYRSPGKRASWERKWMSGAIAVTDARVVVWARGKRIDVPYADSLFDALEVGPEGQDRVLIAFDASAFSPSRSGRIEVRLRTPDPIQIVNAIRAGAAHGRQLQR